MVASLHRGVICEMLRKGYLGYLLEANWHCRINVVCLSIPTRILCSPLSPPMIEPALREKEHNLDAWHHQRLSAVSAVIVKIIILDDLSRG
jgi:hypothetical protein